MPLRPEPTMTEIWDRLRRLLATIAIDLANRIMPVEKQPDPNEILPSSRLIKASFVFDLPRDATRQQIEEWLEFSLNNGSCDTGNPLVDEGLEAAGSVHLEDTHSHLHLRIYRHDGSLHIQKLVEARPYSGPSVNDIVQRNDHPAIIDAPPPWLRNGQG